MKSVQLITVLFIMLYATASFSMLKCPSPGPGFVEILSRLETFSNDMIVEDSCKNLQKDTRAMQSSLSGIGNIFGGGGRELTIPQLSRLIKSSESVIAKAKSIIDQLVQQPQCMKETGVSTLLLISSVTQQVTGMASAFSGPYGIPVSLGGAAISGIIQGVDLLIRKHSYGYDFRKGKHRDLFVTNLCTYHNIRHEIVDMLYPSNRIFTYKTLLDELATREEQLVSNFPLCERYRKIFSLREAALPAINQIRSDFEVASNPDRQPSSWSFCLKMAGMVHKKHSDFVKIIANLPARDLSDIGIIRDLFDFSQSESGVLRPDSCWQKSEKYLSESNLRSKSIISEIIERIENSYNRELDGLIEEGGFADGEKNHVKLLELTLSQIDWASDEYKKLDSLVGENSFRSRKELSSYKKSLDGRFFSKLAPRFMKWYLKDSEKSVSRYKNSLKKYSGKIARRYFGAGIFAKTPDLEKLIERSIREQENNKILHETLYAVTDRLLTKISDAYLAMGTLEDYGKYFSEAGTVSQRINNLTSGVEAVRIKNYLDTQKGLVKVMIEYLDWCHEKGYIKADGAKTLIEKIRKCRLSKILNDPRFASADD